MKNPILITACLISSIFYAQTHRFIYKLVIHKKIDTVKTFMSLDINKDNVKFYDYSFIKEDSIRKKTGKNLQSFSDSDQALIRDKDSYRNRSYFSHGYDYFEITSNDKINWSLEKETKKMQDYVLQKATANFGGRKWIAWFNSEFPFHEGPYKFTGLTGLIFEIYDSENIFHYTLVKSKNIPTTYDTSSFLETHYGKKPIVITLKQYQKIKLDYYNNIVQDLKDFSEKGGTIASDKKLSTSEEINKERKSLQESIRNYYQPIEKDKEIQYPKN